VYVCNCNGIREREVRAAIAAGASRPAEVFKSKGCTPKCAKCVCEMRELITEAREVEPLRYAAE
jgi:bacterioferritin-associated ferredoxin